MTDLTIYPGEIHIGDALHESGEVFVGLRFTDMDTSDAVTIILAPATFDQLVIDLNEAAEKRGGGSATIN